MKKRPSAPPLTGSVSVVGDKSISHRALLLAALAPGGSRLRNLNPGEDVAATATALRAMGARIAGDSKDEVTVEVHGSGLVEPDDVVDAGNSGTTARLLMGIAAAMRGATVLTGDETLRRRPMLRVAAPLRAMGATIAGRRGGDRLPLLVQGGDLTGVEHRSDVASAQVKSAILLAALGAEGRTTVREPARSRDHTERMLAALGVPVSVEGETVSVPGPARPEAFALEVPGDVSAAMYLIAAAILIEGSHITVEGVGLNPGRIGALEVLRRMGADVEWEVAEERCGEPVGSVRARSGPLTATEVIPADIPRLVDEIPILAVLATQSEGRTTFSGAQELRVKESDRIATVAAGIRALGGTVDERPDGLVVEGPVALEGGSVRSEGDHRVALSFAVAELVAGGPVRIEGWSSVDTSFPGFRALLRGAQRAPGAGRTGSGRRR